MYVKILGKNVLAVLIKKMSSLPRKNGAHINPVQPSVLHLLNLRERERKALEAPPLDNIRPYQGRLLSGFLSHATS